MQHVKALSRPPSGGLDLNIADEEEFSPEKLRANVERFYTTAIIGIANFVKHIARLQSWNEPNRTTAFALFYFFFWFHDCLAYLLTATLILLITYPPSRPILFPPVPPSMVSAATGSLKRPPAGAIGNESSLTGAGELHKGEAVEQEASNFVTSFVSMAIKTTAGAQESNQTQEDKGVLDNLTPDPGDLAMASVDAQSIVDGDDPSVDHTRKPIEEIMWEKSRMSIAMHALAEFIDT